MSVPISKRMVYLRRRNEDLLAQLESNSIILEERLKKLRETAKTPRRSDKSWSNLPQSHLKRKYHSWKKRNNSCQVSAAFHASVFQDNSEESSSSELSAKIENFIHTDKLSMKSPAKRTKKLASNSGARRVTISSRGRSPIKPCVKEAPKKKTLFKTSNSDCYCVTLTKENRKLRRDKYIVPDKYLLENVEISSDDSFSNLDSQRKTLEEARSVLSYSPESVFLRRLKKRSQIDLNAVKGSKSKPSSTKGSRKDNVEYAKEKDYRERSLGTPPAENTRSKSAHALTSQHKDAEIRLKSCHCPCEHVGYDILADLQDNSQKSPRLDTIHEEEWVDRLSKFRRSHWFDCHAFPPNAAEKDTRIEDPVFEEPDHGSRDKDGHKCVHRYFLNDRLFPVPLYSDNDARSRCLSCHLPRDSKTKPSHQPIIPREKVEVTLPRRPTHELHQSKPSVAGFKIIGNRTDRVAEKTKYRPCMLKHPITSKQPTSIKSVKPSNSLALRYQKGMI